MEYEYVVFIGRFQPFHNGHLEIIEEALKQGQKVIVALGSHRTSKNIKNPWSSDLRINMIQQSLPFEVRDRLVFISLRDYFYNDQIWLAELHQKVSQITEGSQSVALIGQYTDKSSYYLNLFPQWDFLPLETKHKTHATEIRNMYFRGEPIDRLVPFYVDYYLKNWQKTVDYEELKGEFDFVNKYKEIWAQAPFPPTFVTTDAVVIQSGHVLLVKRKAMPGKGKWALPGGFIKQNEAIVDAALRELFEETRLKVNKDKARACMVGEPKVFDYPGRSLRGRTITHAICIYLKDGYNLPEVKGGDDAEGAQWVPIGDLPLHEDQFYEDHLQIINYWLTKIN